MKYYGVTFNLQGSLTHFGIKGMKKGLRRFQNEDGTLTAEGRDHYGVGDPRQPAGSIAPSPRMQNATHSYRVKKYGKASAKTLEQRPQQLSKKEAQIRKTRAKRILKAAAVIGLSAAIGYGVHRYNKTTDNLIQIAKNHVHDGYKQTESYFKNPQDRANHEMWRVRDISAVRTRSAAKKVLGLKSSRQTRQFIKDNKVASRKLSEIMEIRTGKLVEGYQKSRIGSKYKPYSERKRRRLAERVARNLKDI